MKKLIEIFKNLSAYDHFTVFLIILSALKIAHVFVSTGIESGLHFLKLGAALFVISSVLFFALKFFFDKKKKYQHALISTLLILLVLSHEDPDPLRGVAVIVLVYAAKFFIRFNRRSVFNPIVLGIGAVTLVSMLVPFIDVPPANWAGIDIRFQLFGMAVPIAMLPILLSLIFNVGRIKKHPLALTFIGSSLVLGFFLNVYQEQPVLYVLSTFFIGTAIIVEPKTAPGKKSDQVYFGVLMAVLITIFYLLKIPNAPIIGLMIGNIVYAIYMHGGSYKAKPQATIAS